MFIVDSFPQPQQPCQPVQNNQLHQWWDRIIEGPSIVDIKNQHSQRSGDRQQHNRRSKVLGCGSRIIVKCYMVHWAIVKSMVHCGTVQHNHRQVKNDTTKWGLTRPVISDIRQLPIQHYKPCHFELYMSRKLTLLSTVMLPVEGYHLQGLGNKPRPAASGGLMTSPVSRDSC